MSLLPVNAPNFDDLERFFRDPEVRARVCAALEDGAGVRFLITHEAVERSWILAREHGALLDRPVHIRPDTDLRCSSVDFAALVRGELRPRDGFLSGRLVVNGDVGIVLTLRRALVGSP